jgi:hypothetical protein
MHVRCQAMRGWRRARVSQSSRACLDCTRLQPHMARCRHTYCHHPVCAADSISSWGEDVTGGTSSGNVVTSGGDSSSPCNVVTSGGDSSSPWPESYHSSSPARSSPMESPTLSIASAVSQANSVAASHQGSQQGSAPPSQHGADDLLGQQQFQPQVVLVPMLADTLTEAQVQDLKDLLERRDVSDLQVFNSSELIQNLSTMDERILRQAKSRAEAAGAEAAAAKAELDQGPVQNSLIS